MGVGCSLRGYFYNVSGGPYQEVRISSDTVDAIYATRTSGTGNPSSCEGPEALRLQLVIGAGPDAAQGK